MKRKESPAEKTQKLRRRIEDDARYGIDRVVSDYVSGHPAECQFIALRSASIADRVVEQLLRHYTIRVRRPK